MLLAYIYIPFVCRRSARCRHYRFRKRTAVKCIWVNSRSTPKLSHRNRPKWTYLCRLMMAILYVHIFSLYMFDECCRTSIPYPNSTRRYGMERSCIRVSSILHNYYRRTDACTPINCSFIIEMNHAPYSWYVRNDAIFVYVCCFD